jgi:hypothetical protein
MLLSIRPRSAAIGCGDSARCELRATLCSRFCASWPFRPSLGLSACGLSIENRRHVFPES